MMAMTENPAEEGRLGQSTAARITLASLSGIAAVFCLGIVTGVTAGFLEKGDLSVRAGTIGAVCFAIGLLLLWVAFRQVRAIFAEPMGKNTRRARLMMGVSVLVGVVFGVLMAVGEKGESPILSGADLSPTIAIILAIGALVIVPVLTWVWWRALDEHEAGAYSDGAVVALNFNLSVTAAWWVLARGGLMEPVEAMPVFMLTIVVWSAIWLWKRYF